MYIRFMYFLRKSAWICERGRVDINISREEIRYIETFRRQGGRGGKLMTFVTVLLLIVRKIVPDISSARSCAENIRKRSSNARYKHARGRSVVKGNTLQGASEIYPATV